MTEDKREGGGEICMRGRLWRKPIDVVDPLSGRCHPLNPSAICHPLLPGGEGGWIRAHPRERFQAFTQAFIPLGWGSVVSVQIGKGQLPFLSLQPWMLALLGDGMPQGVWLYLTLFLVHSFHRFPGGEEVVGKQD